MIRNFSFKGTPYVAFGKPTEIPDKVLQNKPECLFFDNFSRVEEEGYYCFRYLADDFDNAVYNSDDDYPFEDKSGTSYKFCAIKKKIYDEMLQNFSYKGTPYVAFKRPTEVPDEVIEHRLECLFFDRFERLKEEGEQCFGYLMEDFDNTTYDISDEYPFEHENGVYFKFCAIKKKTYDEIGKKEDFSSNKNNKSIKGGNNMEKIDLGQIISMKMVSSLVADDKKEIDIGKLMLLQSMQSNGKIEITDVMKAKMISKLGLDNNVDDLPLEKLMLLDMLQNGELDLTKIISVKLMSKLFDEEEKK